MANKKKKAGNRSRQVAKKAINSKKSTNTIKNNVISDTPKKLTEEELKNKKSTKKVTKGSNKNGAVKNIEVKKESQKKEKNTKKTTKTKKIEEKTKNIKKEKVSKTKKTEKTKEKEKKQIKVVTPKEEVLPVLENAKSKKKKETMEPIQQQLSIPEVVTEEPKTIRSNVKKYVIWFLIALVIIVLFLFIMSIYKNKNNKEISFEKIGFNNYLKLYNDNNLDLNYIYITIDNCIGCNQYEEKLDKLRNEYNINIKELNITSLSESELKKLKESNAFIADSIEVPVLLSIKDGKEINGISGNREYSALKNFVEYSTNSTSNSFTKITVNKYISLLNSKDTSVIYIGRPTDSACQKFSKTLEMVASKKGIKVYYLNTDEILSEDNWKKLEESNKIFSKTWFVPAILITRDGNIKDYRMESMDEEYLTKFFTNNGL